MSTLESDSNITKGSAALIELETTTEPSNAVNGKSNAINFPKLISIPLSPTSAIAVSADYDEIDDEIDNAPLPTPTQLTITEPTNVKPTNTATYLQLFRNDLFCSRIIIFLITIFLFLLSLCYTFGQILTVELSDFWCDHVTLSQVRAHSKQINSNEGVDKSCWSTKKNTVKYIQTYSFGVVIFLFPHNIYQG